MNSAPVFSCVRQRPTHAPDDFEDMGNVDVSSFLPVLRGVDWTREARQTEWARRASPSIAVTNEGDGCVLWISGWLPAPIVESDAPVEPLSTVDRREPWYTVGIRNAPALPGITRLTNRHDQGEASFVTFSISGVEEYFEWFFEQNYQALYRVFRW